MRSDHLSRKSLLSFLIRKLLAGLVASAILSNSSLADLDEKALILLEKKAQIDLLMSDEQKTAALNSLLREAESIRDSYPEIANNWAVTGIVRSSYIGSKPNSSIGDLPAVKRARRELEKAIALNERALEGFAHSYLGTLYHFVPRWPIAFGSNRKAEEHLLEALHLNERSMANNLHYALFLLDPGDKKKAKQYLDIARSSPREQSRPHWNLKQRTDIDIALKKIEAVKGQ